MSNILEKYLKKLAEIQKTYTVHLAAIIIVITIVLGAGLKDVSMNSDFRQEMPTDLPIFKLNDRVADSFGGQDTVVVVVQLDDTAETEQAVRDIRDPGVIRSLMFLDQALRDEESVISIASPASFFRGRTSLSDEEITETLRSNPQAAGFFSGDYETALMYISADIGSGEEKIQHFNELIREQIEYAPKPPGVKFSVTGQPILRTAILELLKRDSVFTLAVAATLIFLLLLVMRRSHIEALLIFIPLSLGLIWTMGTLGWLGIPLSVATVGLSSMILGLGVEYGVFVVSRYREERALNRGQLDSLETTVFGIGSAIIGSGLTTIIGFGALSLSSIPMIQHLGQTMALGIVYCLLAALLVNPLLLLLEEDLDYRSTTRKLEKLRAKKEFLEARGAAA